MPRLQPSRFDERAQELLEVADFLGPLDELRAKGVVEEAGSSVARISLAASGESGSRAISVARWGSRQGRVFGIASPPSRGLV